METVKPIYFLALMRRPGDYVFIDIPKLSIAQGFTSFDLAEIDLFTMRFTNEEIKQAIKQANIVEDSYLDGKLVIQDNQKHNPLVVIDKNQVKDFNLAMFFEKYLNNDLIMNDIRNKLASIVKDPILLELFKTSIKNKDINKILTIILQIEYFHQRKYIIYLIEISKREKDKENNLLKHKLLKNKKIA